MSDATYHAHWQQSQELHDRGAYATGGTGRPGSATDAPMPPPNVREAAIRPVARAYCQLCGWIHSEHGSTTTVGRFTDAPRYRARYDGAPLRDTRAQANADMCAHYQEINP